VGDQLLTVVPDEGLGNAPYLVDLGDGRALAVDASRDLRRLRAEAERRGLRIAYSADTHLHADFLSGAVQLAATDGVEVIASRAGHREFPHRGLDDGDEVDLGGLTLRALGTPGHTEEHLAYLLLDGARELGVFSGGSLLVGTAARVDLVSPDRTEALARAQYRSLRRLAGLDPDTALWPTHGGGSFCSTAVTQAGAVSTIGLELVSNPLLRATDEDAFVQQLSGTFGSYPTYFRRLQEVNRRGPEVLDAPRLEPLQPTEVVELLARGAELVDVRPMEVFARAHAAGALSIQLRPAFASWLGWLVPPDRPVVVLRDATQDVDELLWQALKIGHTVVGEVAGGLDAWRSAGLPIASIPLVGPDQAARARVLDIRQDSEYDAGHLPGADHLELGELPGHTSELLAGPLVVMCGHGERAMSAASLLVRAGARGVRVLDGGADDVAREQGIALEVGR